MTQSTNEKHKVSASLTASRYTRRDVPGCSHPDAKVLLDVTFVPPCQKHYAENRGGARTAACSSSTATAVAR